MQWNELASELVQHVLYIAPGHVKCAHDVFQAATAATLNAFFI